MHLKEQKYFLEGYGFLRLCLGIAQLTALLYGYFLNEWVIRYPRDVLPALFDADIVAFIYLAVIIRSFFHIIVGVGIARIRNWARIWIFCGWPVLLMVNLGVAYTLHQQWVLSAEVTRGFWQTLIWGKVIIYILFILFDLIFVASAVKSLEDNQEILTETGGRVENRKIAVFFLMVVFGLSVLLFLARPIRQGFHRGYYKISGKKKFKEKDVPALEARRTISKKESLSTSGDKGGVIQRTGVYQMKKSVSPVIDETGPAAGAKRLVKGVKKTGIKGGIAYPQLIGYAFALCLMAGFLLRVGNFKQGANVKAEKSVSENGVFIIGFVLMTIYGIIQGMPLFWITGTVCAVLNSVLLWLVFKE